MKYFLLLWIFSFHSFAREINTPKNLEGVLNTYSSKQLKDKIIVLEWFNKGCPFVKKFYSVGFMQKLQKKWVNKKNIVWFNVISSADDKQGHETKTQAKKTRINLGAQSTDTILDPNGKLGKLFGAVATPHFFILKNNQVLYEGAIDSIPNTESEDIKKATNYIEKALLEITNNQKVSIKKTKAYGCSVKYPN
tara:strand:+ start:2771 stop:3349 length:579 start_codon:yes stop_codon:yes gene_type:complete